MWALLHGMGDVRRSGGSGPGLVLVLPGAVKAAGVAEVLAEPGLAPVVVLPGARPVVGRAGLAGSDGGLWVPSVNQWGGTAPAEGGLLEVLLPALRGVPGPEGTAVPAVPAAFAARGGTRER